MQPPRRFQRVMSIHNSFRTLTSPRSPVYDSQKLFVRLIELTASTNFQSVPFFFLITNRDKTE